jgi:hypothetical protein
MDSRRWEQLGAAMGIAFVVAQLAAQSLIQAGRAEPPFYAESTEIVGFFSSRNSRLFGLGDYLSTLSVIPFVGWLSALWARLRRAEGAAGWLSVAAFGSGLVTATQVVSGGGWTLAMGRIGGGLGPELARTLFDMGNLTFANIWVSLAGMLLAAGILSIRADALPRWLGWSGLAIALGLVVARAFWERSGITFMPYGLFWLWLIAASVALMRRAGDAAAER